MPLDSFHILAMAITAFFVGFFKATLGLAIGTLLVPFMVFFWPTKFVFGIIAVQMWISDYFAIKLFWKKWDGRLVKLVLPGLFFGILLGTYLLVLMPDYWLRKGLGAVCLFSAGHQARREFAPEISVPRIGPWLGHGIGFTAGTVSTLFHSGGMILSLYLLSQGLTKVSIVSSTIAIWIFMNPVKLSSYWMGGVVDPTMILVGIVAIPLTFAGLWTGRRALERVPQRAYNLCVLVFSAAAAAKLLAE